MLQEVQVPLHSSHVISLGAVYHLYIPIWFYSNRPALFVELKTDNFTFQSGSILMLLVFYNYQHDKELYIPIWFYSNCPI